MKDTVKYARMMMEVLYNVLPIGFLLLLLAISILPLISTFCSKKLFGTILLYDSNSSH